jgi:hypothetical protein
MSSANAKTFTASLIIGGAVVSLFFTLRGGSPHYDAAPHEAVGQVLAEEVAKMAGGSGQIVLLSRDTTVFKSPATVSLVKGFFKTLRTAGRSVAATNLFKVDPNRLIRVPPGDFFEILRKLSEQDVVVSLMGPPLLSAEQRAKLGDKHARVVAFCSGPLPRQVNLKEVFEQGLLSVAIISRPTISMSPPQANVPRAWFDYLYQVITLENLAEMPLPLESKTP